MKPFIILSFLLATISFAEEFTVSTGPVLVEVNLDRKFSRPIITGDPARALYESMTDVTPVDSPTAYNHQFTTKKGPALECNRVIDKGGTSFTCVFAFNSNGESIPLKGL